MVVAAVSLTVIAVIAWLVQLARGRPLASPAVARVGFAGLAVTAVWLALVAFYAPIEAVQGVVQKIFYVHVGTVLPSYLGFALSAIGGVGYLVTRDDAWDRLGLSAAEVGVVFCSLILLVGPLWAKPVWGHYWVWDLRLFSTLVLWFIYVAYLFLRGLTYGSDSAKTFASIYAIIGTAAIPFVYKAVDLARGDTLHPSNPAREGLPEAMSHTLGVGMIALLILFAWDIDLLGKLSQPSVDLFYRVWTMTLRKGSR